MGKLNCHVKFMWKGVRKLWGRGVVWESCEVHEELMGEREFVGKLNCVMSCEIYERIMRKGKRVGNWVVWKHVKFIRKGVRKLGGTWVLWESCDIYENIMGKRGNLCQNCIVRSHVKFMWKGSWRERWVVCNSWGYYGKKENLWENWIMCSCEIHERTVGKGRFVGKLKCVKSCEIHVKRREKVMRKLSCKKRVKIIRYLNGNHTKMHEEVMVC